MTRASFLLKVVLRRFRLRLLRGACEERISINAHDSAPARGASTLRSPCSCHGIIGERRNTVVYDFTFGVRCRCQCALRRHALTANHEWQVIAMVDTHNAEGLGGRRTPPCDSHRLRMGAWRNPCDVQNWWPWRAEWSAGDYRGIITPALCTCDLCLICN